MYATSKLQTAICMKTDIGRFAEAMLESCWLAALIMVPLFFNIWGERVFEGGKVHLLRSIAVLSAAFLVVRFAERKRQQAHRIYLPWRAPMALPFLLMAAVYLIGTAFSVDPPLSFWGSSYRGQGTYTQLSIMVFFLLIALALRSKSQLDRLITVVLITSSPVAFYGIAQAAGMDPVPWGKADVGRVFSTEGNPIFLAAYMIMIVPFTIMRMIQEVGFLRVNLRKNGSPSVLFLPVLRAAAYGSLLVLQLAAIVLTRSRGPVAGLLAGLFFFLLVFAVQRRRRFLSLMALTVAIGGLAVLILANSAYGPFSRLPDIPVWGRIFEISEPFRLSHWKGSINLLKADPVRALVGYGPETFHLVFPPYTPLSGFVSMLSRRLSTGLTMRPWICW